MKKIKVPETIDTYKSYGNSLCGFRIDILKRENAPIIAYVCGECKLFENTADGIAQMEQWVNEQRLRVAKALKLVSKEEQIED